jgi:hypothetical protein
VRQRLPAILLVALVLIGTALAAPNKRPRRPKQPKTPAAGSGSGSASGSASTPVDALTPAPTPPPPPSPSPAPAPAPVPVAPPVGERPLAPPGSVAPVPPMKPSLAMRPTEQAHGGFVNDMDCSACHTTGGWNLATTAGASGFDHDRTGFALRGSHKQTTCGRCHTGQAKPANNCEGCHKDPHEGRNDEPCVNCHTATSWTDVSTLEQHRRTRMPLTGRHAQIDCVACHTRGGGRTFSDLPTDCYSCHRARFNDPNTHPTHNGTTGTELFPRDCGLCHQPTTWSFAVRDPTMLPGATMARTGGHDGWFVLSTGSHRGAACTSCHVDPQRVVAVRCDGCHDDVTLRKDHRGATQPRAAVACLRCHPRGTGR